MRAVQNWQRRRVERHTRMIAAARRRQMEQLLESGPVTAPRAAQPASDHRHGAAALTWTLGTSLAAMFGLGVGGPFFGGTWDPVPLLVAASLVVLGAGESYRHLRRADVKVRLTGVLLVLVVASSFVMGVRGQVTVDDKPQWRYSRTAQANELALAIRSDLYVLQENQSLFSYPPEQARSMLAYYESAAAQAELIAARWNPATAPAELPLPGFLTVLERVNSAADQQRQALAGFAEYVRQPDPRLAERVQAAATAAEQNYLLAAQELARIVTPLGLELAPDEA